MTHAAGSPASAAPSGATPAREALARATGLGRRGGEQALAALERLVGGRVVSAERQPRWRPAFFAELERAGERVPVYFRGDRGLGEGGVYRLEHEMAVLQVLAAHGIPVPRVYGFCDAPRGIVMERSPGRADLSTASDEAERRAVLDHYVEILAAMHGIDPAAFEAIGLRRPQDARANALVDLPVWEAGFRRASRRPEPLIEYALAWLKRNVPPGRARSGFVANDAGQFLFDAGRVTAVIDLELATLGDSLADLAAMRCRDASEPLGELSPAFLRYAALRGEALDVPALHFHTARFALGTPLATAPLCASPPPGLNLVQYMGWNVVFGRLAIEAIAAYRGQALAPPALPEASATRHSAAHDVLVSLLEPGARAGSYEVDTALRVAQHLREADRLGPALAALDLDEAAALLGTSPRDRDAADAALVARIAGAGDAREAEWIAFLHRRALRDEALLQPALRELANRALQPLALGG